jgi:tripartite-type tricarboxylate transporter receptor subunit TctC
MPKEVIMCRSIANYLVVVAISLLLASGLAAAQPYPNHPVRLLVGGAAGSVPDIMARPVAERLSAVLGQPVIVDNRPGAAGSIAMDVLIHSAPDGYTLALATMSQAVFNSYLFTKLPYDPLRDLEPVSPLVTGAMAIAAHPSFPANTIQELIPLARSQPGRLFMAMPQTGSPPHVIALLLSRAAAIELTLVPHKAGSEALNAVLSNQIPLLIDAPTILSPYVADGRLKALAVTGSEREPALPGVATASESGLENLHGEAWIGLVGPAGMPKDIVQRINRELALILAAPDMQAQLARLSFRRLTSTPEEFRALIKADHATWGSVIRDAGLKLD